MYFDDRREHALQRVKPRRQESAVSPAQAFGLNPVDGLPITR